MVLFEDGLAKTCVPVSVLVVGCPARFHFLSRGGVGRWMGLTVDPQRQKGKYKYAAGQQRIQNVSRVWLEEPPLGATLRGEHGDAPWPLTDDLKWSQAASEGYGRV